MALWTSAWARRPPLCEPSCAGWWPSTSRRTSSGRSPTTRPTWRWPSGSAGCSPSAACSAWPGPSEFGGRDASPWEQTVVREEMWAHHEPRGAQYMGVNWVGPTIMRHGTPEQQRTHLPPIARGEVIWCQGFSEPDAGSDLASLRTAARRDGDGWRVTGQKIWTSYATHGAVVLPARPDLARGEEAARDHGLPGADVRPGNRGPADPSHDRARITSTRSSSTICG